MYLILVYDVEQERVAKVCQYLRQHLHWVQNSVFEGELTKAQIERVKAG
ncbi:MAG: CRISPR-associated endonuclease Cas2, partial [Salinibacter sp.]